MILALTNTTTFFQSFQLILWLLNFLMSLAGVFTSIYIVILHDDLKQKFIPAGELADSLQRYCPLEYAAAGFYTLSSVLVVDSAPLAVRLMSVPLFLFNIRRFIARDHKLYFIHPSEYKKDYQRMEFQYQVKTCYYAVLFVTSLVMAILTAIDFFDLIT